MKQPPEPALGTVPPRPMGRPRKAAAVKARREALIQALLTHALEAYEAMDDTTGAIALEAYGSCGEFESPSPITRDKRILTEAAQRFARMLNQEGYQLPGHELRVTVRGTYWPMSPKFVISEHHTGRAMGERPGRK